MGGGGEWMGGLQSRDGGWAAFDANNLEYYLNNIPFSDHGALLDPPTEDVTARCISMLAQLGETAPHTNTHTRPRSHLPPLTRSRQKQPQKKRGGGGVFFYFFASHPAVRGLVV